MQGVWDVLQLNALWLSKINQWKPQQWLILKECYRHSVLFQLWQIIYSYTCSVPIESWCSAMFITKKTFHVGQAKNSQKTSIQYSSCVGQITPKPLEHFWCFLLTGHLCFCPIFTHLWVASFYYGQVHLSLSVSVLLPWSMGKSRKPKMSQVFLLSPTHVKCCLIRVIKEEMENKTAVTRPFKNINKRRKVFFLVSQTFTALAN